MTRGNWRARFEEFKDEDRFENYESNVLEAVRVVRALLPALRKATELCSDGLRVNSVCRGGTLTSLWRNRAEALGEERGVAAQTIIDEFAEEIPLKRFARPEEIAAMVVFLCSEMASYVTGQSISVNGGIARGFLWFRNRAAEDRQRATRLPPRGE